MADVLTAENEMTRFSFPIMKSEETAAINPVDGTPDLVIVGKATDGTLDSDLQIVDPDASLRWIERWHATKSNVRMAHDPHKPVGRGLEVDGHLVKALISDPTAKHLIRTKVLNDFSIGIMHPDIRVGDPRFKHLDPEGKAVKGIITDRADGMSQLGEISVVDRGANYGSAFQIAKAAADGTPEFTGKMLGEANGSGPDAETLEKAAKRFSPVDLAKILAIRARAEEKEREDLAKAAQPGADEEGGENAMDDERQGDGDDAEAGESGKTAEPDATGLAVPDEVKAAEAAVYKRDIDTATRRRLAQEGKALPNLSYPIENEEDLHNAAKLAQSGHGDVAAAKRLIARRAEELGVANPLDGDAEKAAQPKMRVPCPKCSKACKPGASFCGKCGTAMKADKAASPGDGVTAEHTKPVPEHREPDGTAAELFEQDAGMADGDEASEMARERKIAPPAAEDAMTGKAAMDAALRHRAAGVTSADGVLHDLLCPAYSPDSTAKCFGTVTIASAADPTAWQEKALDAVANLPLVQARAVGEMWDHAIVLKGADPDDIADLRNQAHEAFLEANKSTDAKPGPTTFPVPTELSPTRFRRPYVSAGHAASPQPDGSHHVTIPSGDHPASQYDRGPLTAGHESPSPGSPTSPDLVPTPGVTGKPNRTYYRATARERSEHAMRVLHDHIAETHPDLCPMHGPGLGGQPPAGARQVPAAAGTRKDAEPDETKAAAKPTIKPGKVPCPKCSKKVKAAAKFCPGCGGSMSADKAAGVSVAKGGDGPPVAPGYDLSGDERGHAASNAHAFSGGTQGDCAACGLPANAFVHGGPGTGKQADPDVVKAALDKALAPVLKRLDEQQDLIDQMASAPDPRYAPFKAVAQGGVLEKMFQPEREPDTVEKRAERIRAGIMADLQEQIRNSPDPNVREQSWAAYNQMIKLAEAPAQP